MNQNNLICIFADPCCFFAAMVCPSGFSHKNFSMLLFNNVCDKKILESEFVCKRFWMAFHNLLMSKCLTVHSDLQ